jgi:hypothetical protein
MGRPSAQRIRTRVGIIHMGSVLTLSSSPSRFLFEDRLRSKVETSALNEGPDILGDGLGQGGRGGAFMLATSS